MSGSQSPNSNRRDFLSGRSLKRQAEHAGEILANHLDQAPKSATVPESGPTVRLATRAMACEFCVIQNPGGHGRTTVVSDALDMLHSLEQQMTVYREDSDLSLLNHMAADGGTFVDADLFDVIKRSAEIAKGTDCGFDPTAGPLVSLWGRCRSENRIPTANEIASELQRTGIEHVSLDQDQLRISFDRNGIELNLGGIGKGHALDVAGGYMLSEDVNEWLFHGGHSSLLAQGDHNQQGGWPVGIRNPLFTERRLATITLRDQGMSTSGSNVQFFRHEGRRFGHILDPRTGWPVEDMLSVTVLAPTAAEADALSTAFFVRGVENARRYCDNRPFVSALLIPPPRRGRTLDVFVFGIPDEVLFFHDKDINVIKEV